MMEKFSTNRERTIFAFLLYQTVLPNYILTNLQLVRPRLVWKFKSTPAKGTDWMINFKFSNIHDSSLVARNLLESKHLHESHLHLNMLH